MTNIYIASIYLRDKSVRVLCNALSVHMTHLFCDTARVGTDMKFGYAGTISSRASQTQTPPIPAGSAHLVPGYEVERCMGAWRNVCLAMMFMMVNQVLGCKRKPAVTSRLFVRQDMTNDLDTLFINVQHLTALDFFEITQDVYKSAEHTITYKSYIQCHQNI